LFVTFAVNLFFLLSFGLALTKTSVIFVIPRLAVQVITLTLPASQAGGLFAGC